MSDRECRFWAGRRPCETENAELHRDQVLAEAEADDATPHSLGASLASRGLKIDAVSTNGGWGRASQYSGGRVGM